MRSILRLRIKPQHDNSFMNPVCTKYFSLFFASFGVSIAFGTRWTRYSSIILCCAQGWSLFQSIRKTSFPPMSSQWNFQFATIEMKCGGKQSYLNFIFTWNISRWKRSHLNDGFPSNLAFSKWKSDFITRHIEVISWKRLKCVCTLKWFF